MKHFTILLLFVLNLTFTNSIIGQKLDHILGEFIVQPNTSIREFCYSVPDRQLSIKKCLSKDLNIWLVSFDYVRINEQDLLSTLSKSRHTESVQVNHLIEYRSTIPNDPLFTNQWQYINLGSNGGVADADLDAEEAWDITTGGITPNGDTIVVCIIDGGIEYDHPDFGNNLWINHQEIEDNNIDDDNNGYIDDYRGWNTSVDSDNFNVNNMAKDIDHGTSVSGIVGAKGNNGIGVTGVNWDVKIMFIEGGGDEADAIAAYNYPYQMRKMYNESNGAKGAFVVATNASWGIEKAYAADNPIWCDFYNKMGKEGIVSVAATANKNFDVDVVGDMPTSCTSDYLITVTNIQRDNVKKIEAGYGSQSIDMGAYGAESYTTEINMGYDAFGGTSGATPHVTGTIALLYAAPCSNFSYLALQDPAGTALKAIDYIFDGIVPNASLAGITVKGGVLNMKNSLDNLISDCPSCPLPAAISAIHINTSKADISWVNPQTATSVILEWKSDQDSDWTIVPDAMSPYELSSLEKCQTYTYRLKTICGGEDGAYSPIYEFETDGCCKNPEQVVISKLNITETSAIIQWSPVTAASDYNIRYREQHTSEWTIVNSTITVLSVTDLSSCTDYELGIQSNCIDGSIDYSDAFIFNTKGCASCYEHNYCTSRGNGQGDGGEWIESFEIDGEKFTSGFDMSGYGDYTGNFFVLEPGKTYPITIIPGFDGLSYLEYSKIWIDYNNDGTISPTVDLAYDQVEGSKDPAIGTITIPTDAILGSTRLRLSMKFNGNNEPSPEPCNASFEYGEVEDYCVKIVDLSKPIIGLDTIWVSHDRANMTWNKIAEADSYTIEYKKSTASSWNSLISNHFEFIIKDLTICTDYDVRVIANYAHKSGLYSDVFNFKTDCQVGNKDLGEFASFNIFPNPFSSFLDISFENSISKSVDVKMYDILGNVVYSESNHEVNQDLNVIRINNLNSLQNGIFFIELVSENQRSFQKIIHQK